VYGAVYAASKEYFLQHKEQGLYHGNDEILTFIDTFYIMNIHRRNPWHQHIIKQYQNAVREMGFSGIHMDTYGFPKEAYGFVLPEEKDDQFVSENMAMGEKIKIQLAQQFGSLIDDTKEELEQICQESYLIFNNVGNWPVKTVADSRQDAIYIEVWKPYERYFHILQIVKEAKTAGCDSKPVILAAYMEPFRKESMERAGYAAQLLLAFIISAGAYNLLFGEENGILTQGYYVDHSKMTVEQTETMRSYYDFMIRYMNLFYDDSMEEVTMTHAGWDNYEYAIESTWSAYGEPDKISCILRQNATYKTITMINLCGQKEDYWNLGKNAPVRQNNITIRVHVDQKIKAVYLASPDKEGGRSIQLAYAYQNNNRGIFVEFIVPELECWNLIYLVL
jgi:dextranase